MTFCRSLHEIQAVASLPSHPNVVTLHRAWQQKGHFYIQMDLAENGSLGSILRQVRSSFNFSRLQVLHNVFKRSHPHFLNVCDAEKAGGTAAA